jgi:hypothetical protein
MHFSLPPRECLHVFLLLPDDLHQPLARQVRLQHPQDAPAHRHQRRAVGHVTNGALLVVICVTGNHDQALEAALRAQVVDVMKFHSLLKEELLLLCELGSEEVVVNQQPLDRFVKRIRDVQAPENLLFALLQHLLHVAQILVAQ